MKRKKLRSGQRECKGNGEFLVRTSPERHRAMIERAAASRRSLNGEVEKALDAWLAAPEPGV